MLVASRGARYNKVGIPGTGLSARNYAKLSDPESAQRYQNAVIAGVLIAIGVIVVLVIIGMATQK